MKILLIACWGIMLFSCMLGNMLFSYTTNKRTVCFYELMRSVFLSLCDTFTSYLIAIGRGGFFKECARESPVVYTAMCIYIYMFFATLLAIVNLFILHIIMVLGMQVLHFIIFRFCFTEAHHYKL